MIAQKYSLNLIGFVDSPYAHMPAATVYSRAGQEGLSRYRKSITEGRRQDLQRQAMTLMSNPGVDVKEQARHRRDAVLQRVTREFWTNLVTRGEDTAMLRHLQAKIREEYGDDISFSYQPGETYVVVMHEGENGPEPVGPQKQTAIMSSAWKITREIVASHMIQ